MKQRSKTASSFGSLPSGGDSEEGAKGPRIVSESAGSAPGGSASELSKLERVRDLLFGEQVAEQTRGLTEMERRMEERFLRLEAEATDMEERFDARLAAATGAMADEIRAEIAAMSRRLDDQGVQKLERSEFRSMLSELAKRVGE